MKKQLYIKNQENKIVYHPEAVVFFSENKVKNGKTKDGKSFMIMPTEKTFHQFCENFIFSEDLTIVVKQYSAGELFAYYDRMCEANEKLLGEITSVNSFLGDGIYTITENDFLNSEDKEKMISDFNYERVGYQTDKETIMIVQYFGYYYKVVSSKYNSLCKLITSNIPLDNIKTVMELSIIVK